MANTGKEYELFVAKLQQAILNADTYASQKNIQVEVNKKIKDNCGIDRQFDIYWEYELGGITYKTAIECKDYDSKISVEKIDSLIGKIRDIPDLKAVFATKTGYQSGAQTKALNNKIDLLIVREQNDSDWTDKDGTPLVKKILIHLTAHMPPRIEKFEPNIDTDWIKSNTSIDTSKPISLSGSDIEIFIEDLTNNKTTSLYDLARQLTPNTSEEFGLFTSHQKLENAFIYKDELKLKINGYKIEYRIPKPIYEPIEIDFSKELVGVIEYLQKGDKKTIFNGGIIK